MNGSPKNVPGAAIEALMICVMDHQLLPLEPCQQKPESPYVVIGLLGCGSPVTRLGAFITRWAVARSAFDAAIRLFVSSPDSACGGIGLPSGPIPGRSGLPSIVTGGLGSVPLGGRMLRGLSDCSP